MPERRLIAGSVAVGVVLALLEVTGPLFTRAAVDGCMVPRTLEPLPRIISGLVVVLTTIAGLRFVYNRLTRRIEYRLGEWLRSRWFRYVLHRPMAEHDQVPVGARLSRLGRDVDVVSEFVAHGAGPGVSDAVILLGTLAVLMWMNWRSTLLMMVGVPFLGLLRLTLGSRRRHAHDALAESAAVLNGWLTEVVRGRHALQVLQAIPWAEARVHGAQATYRDFAIRSAWLDHMVQPVAEVIGVIVVGCVVTFGSWEVQAGRLTLGELVAFNTGLALCRRSVR